MATPSIDITIKLLTKGLDELNKLKDAINALSTQTGEMSEGAGKLGASMNGVVSQATSTTQSLSTLTTALGGALAGLTEASKASTGASTALGSAATSAEAAATSITSLSASSTGAGASMEDVGAGATKAATALESMGTSAESASTSVQTAAQSSESAATSLEGVSASATAAATSLEDAAKSAEAAGVSMAEAAVSSNSVSTSLESAATSAESAAVSLGSVATAAEGVGTSLTDIGTSATSAATSLAATSTSAEDAATSLESTATSAEDAGASLESVGTAATDAASSLESAATSSEDAAKALTDTATSAESAATSLEDAATSAGDTASALNDAATSAGDAATAFEDVATSAEDAAASMQGTATSATDAGASATAAAAAIQQAAVAMQSAAQASTQNTQALQALSGKFDSLTNAATSIAKELPGIGGALTALQNPAGALKSAITDLIGAFTGLVAMYGVGKMTEYAARTETLGITLKMVGRNAGYTESEINKFQKAVEKQGITTQAASEALTQMIQAGLPLGPQAGQSASNVERLARASQDLAVVTGENSSDTFKRLITNIQQLDTMGLRFMGITTDVQGAEEKYAASIGKAATALSQQEKVLAVNNEVLIQAEKLQGAYEASMEAAGKKAASLKRYTEELANAMGQELLPAYGALVDEATFFLQSLEKIAKATDTSKTAAKSLGESVRQFASELSESGQVIARTGADNIDLFGSMAESVLGAGTEIMAFVNDIGATLEELGILQGIIGTVTVAFAALKDTITFLHGVGLVAFGGLVNGIGLIIKAQGEWLQILGKIIPGLTGIGESLSATGSKWMDVGTNAVQQGKLIDDALGRNQGSLGKLMGVAQETKIVLSDFGKATNLPMLNKELALFAEASARGALTTRDMAKAQELVTAETVKLIASNKLNKDELGQLIATAKQVGIVLPAQFQNAAMALEALRVQSVATSKNIAAIGTGGTFQELTTQARTLQRSVEEGSLSAAAASVKYIQLDNANKALAATTSSNVKAQRELAMALSAVAGDVQKKYDEAIKGMGVSVTELRTGVAAKSALIAASLEAIAGSALATGNTFSLYFNQALDQTKNVSMLQALGKSIDAVKEKGNQLLNIGELKEGANAILQAEQASVQLAQKFDEVFAAQLKNVNTKDEWDILNKSVVELGKQGKISTDTMVVAIDQMVVKLRQISPEYVAASKAMEALNPVAKELDNNLKLINQTIGQTAQQAETAYGAMAKGYQQLGKLAGDFAKEHISELDAAYKQEQLRITETATSAADADKRKLDAFNGYQTEKLATLVKESDAVLENLQKSQEAETKALNAKLAALDQEVIKVDAALGKQLTSQAEHDQKIADLATKKQNLLNDFNGKTTQDKINALNSRKSAYEQYIQALVSEEEKLLNKVKQYDEEAKQLKMSTEEFVRSLRKGAMDEAGKYAETQKQISEKQAELSKAAANGEVENAKKLMSSIQSLSQELARGYSENGKVVVSAQAGASAAIRETESAASKMGQAYANASATAKSGASEIEARTAAARTEVTNLNTQIGDLRTKFEGGIKTNIVLNSKEAEQKVKDLQLLLDKKEYVSEIKLKVESAQQAFEAMRQAISEGKPITAEMQAKVDTAVAAIRQVYNDGSRPIEVRLEAEKALERIAGVGKAIEDTKRIKEIELTLKTNAAEVGSQVEAIKAKVAEATGTKEVKLSLNTDATAAGFNIVNRLTNEHRALVERQSTLKVDSVEAQNNLKATDAALKAVTEATALKRKLDLDTNGYMVSLTEVTKKQKELDEAIAVSKKYKVDTEESKQALADVETKRKALGEALAVRQTFLLDINNAKTGLEGIEAKQSKLQTDLGVPTSMKVSVEDALKNLKAVSDAKKELDTSFEASKTLKLATKQVNDDLLAIKILTEQLEQQKKINIDSAEVQALESKLELMKGKLQEDHNYLIQVQGKEGLEFADKTLKSVSIAKDKLASSPFLLEATTGPVDKLKKILEGLLDDSASLNKTVIAPKTETSFLDSLKSRFLELLGLKSKLEGGDGSAPGAPKSGTPKPDSQPADPSKSNAITSAQAIEAGNRARNAAAEAKYGEAAQEAARVAAISAASQGKSAQEVSAAADKAAKELGNVADASAKATQALGKAGDGKQDAKSQTSPVQTTAQSKTEAQPSKAEAKPAQKWESRKMVDGSDQPLGAPVMSEREVYDDKGNKVKQQYQDYSKLNIDYQNVDHVVDTMRSMREKGMEIPANLQSAYDSISKAVNNGQYDYKNKRLKDGNDQAAPSQSSSSRGGSTPQQTGSKVTYSYPNAPEGSTVDAAGRLVRPVYEEQAAPKQSSYKAPPKTQDDLDLEARNQRMLDENSRNGGVATHRPAIDLVTARGNKIQQESDARKVEAARPDHNLQSMGDFVKSTQGTGVVKVTDAYGRVSYSDGAGIAKEAGYSDSRVQGLTSPDSVRTGQRVGTLPKLKSTELQNGGKGQSPDTMEVTPAYTVNANKQYNKIRDDLGEQARDAFIRGDKTTQASAINNLARLQESSDSGEFDRVANANAANQPANQTRLVPRLDAKDQAVNSASRLEAINKANAAVNKTPPSEVQTTAQPTPRAPVQTTAQKGGDTAGLALDQVSALPKGGVEIPIKFTGNAEEVKQSSMESVNKLKAEVKEATPVKVDTDTDAQETAKTATEAVKAVPDVAPKIAPDASQVAPSVDTTKTEMGGIPEVTPPITPNAEGVAPAVADANATMATAQGVAPAIAPDTTAVQPAVEATNTSLAGVTPEVAPKVEVQSNAPDVAQDTNAALDGVTPKVEPAIEASSNTDSVVGESNAALKTVPETTKSDIVGEQSVSQAADTAVSSLKDVPESTPSNIEGSQNLDSVVSTAKDSLGEMPEVTPTVIAGTQNVDSVTEDANQALKTVPDTTGTSVVAQEDATATAANANAALKTIPESTSTSVEATQNATDAATTATNALRGIPSDTNVSIVGSETVGATATQASEAISTVPDSKGVDFTANDGVSPVAGAAGEAVNNVPPDKKVTFTGDDQLSSVASQATTAASGVPSENTTTFNAQDDVTGVAGGVVNAISSTPTEHATEFTASSQVEVVAGSATEAMALVPPEKTTVISGETNVPEVAGAVNGAIDGIPSEVPINFNGQEEVSTVAANVTNAIASVQEPAPTNFAANDGVTPVAEAANASASSLPSNVSVSLSAQDGVSSVAQGAQGAMDGLQDRTVTATAIGDSSGADEVSGAMEQVVDKETTLTVNAVGAGEIQAIPGQMEAAAQDKTGSVTISTNASEALGEVNSLNGQNTNSTHGVADNASEAASHIQSLNGQNTSSTHTITVIENKVSGGSAPGGALGGTVTTSGIFPAYAQGGQVVNVAYNSPTDVTHFAKGGEVTPRFDPSTGRTKGVSANLTPAMLAQYAKTGSTGSDAIDTVVAQAKEHSTRTRGASVQTTAQAGQDEVPKFAKGGPVGWGGNGRDIDAESRLQANSRKGSTPSKARRSLKETPVIDYERQEFEDPHARIARENEEEARGGRRTSEDERRVYQSKSGAGSESLRREATAKASDTDSRTRTYLKDDAGFAQFAEGGPVGGETKLPEIKLSKDTGKEESGKGQWLLQPYKFPMPSKGVLKHYKPEIVERFASGGSVRDDTYFRVAGLSSAEEAVLRKEFEDETRELEFQLKDMQAKYQPATVSAPMSGYTNYSGGSGGSTGGYTSLQSSHGNGLASSMARGASTVGGAVMVPNVPTSEKEAFEREKARKELVHLQNRIQRRRSSVSRGGVIDRPLSENYQVVTPPSKGGYARSPMGYKYGGIVKGPGFAARSSGVYQDDAFGRVLKAELRGQSDATLTGYGSGMGMGFFADGGAVSKVSTDSDGRAAELNRVLKSVENEFPPIVEEEKNLRASLDSDFSGIKEDYTLKANSIEASNGSDEHKTKAMESLNTRFKSYRDTYDLRSKQLDTKFAPFKAKKEWVTAQVTKTFGGKIDSGDSYKGVPRLFASGGSVRPNESSGGSWGGSSEVSSGSPKVSDSLGSSIEVAGGANKGSNFEGGISVNKGKTADDKSGKTAWEAAKAKEAAEAKALSDESEKLDETRRYLKAKMDIVLRHATATFWGNMSSSGYSVDYPRRSTENYQGYARMDLDILEKIKVPITGQDEANIKRISDDWEKHGAIYLPKDRSKISQEERPYFKFANGKVPTFAKGGSVSKDGGSPPTDAELATQEAEKQSDLAMAKRDEELAKQEAAKPSKSYSDVETQQIISSKKAAKADRDAEALVAIRGKAQAAKDAAAQKAAEDKVAASALQEAKPVTKPALRPTRPVQTTAQSGATSQNGVGSSGSSESTLPTTKPYTKPLRPSTKPAGGDYATSGIWTPMAASSGASIKPTAETLASQPWTPLAATTGTKPKPQGGDFNGNNPRLPKPEVAPKPTPRPKPIGRAGKDRDLVQNFAEGGEVFDPLNPKAMDAIEAKEALLLGLQAEQRPVRGTQKVAARLATANTPETKGVEGEAKPEGGKVEGGAGVRSSQASPQPAQPQGPTKEQIEAYTALEADIANETSQIEAKYRSDKAKKAADETAEDAAARGTKEAIETDFTTQSSEAAVQLQSETAEAQAEHLASLEEAESSYKEELSSINGDFDSQIQEVTTAATLEDEQTKAAKTTAGIEGETQDSVSATELETKLAEIASSVQVANDSYETEVNNATEATEGDIELATGSYTGELIDLSSQEKEATRNYGLVTRDAAVEEEIETTKQSTENTITSAERAGLKNDVATAENQDTLDRDTAYLDLQGRDADVDRTYSKAKSDADIAYGDDTRVIGDEVKDYQIAHANKVREEADALEAARVQLEDERNAFYLEWDEENRELAKEEAEFHAVWDNATGLTGADIKQRVKEQKALAKARAELGLKRTKQDKIFAAQGNYNSTIKGITERNWVEEDTEFNREVAAKKTHAENVHTYGLDVANFEQVEGHKEVGVDKADWNTQKAIAAKQFSADYRMLDLTFSNQDKDRSAARAIIANKFKFLKYKNPAEFAVVMDEIRGVRGKSEEKYSSDQQYMQHSLNAKLGELSGKNRIDQAKYTFDASYARKDHEANLTDAKLGRKLAAAKVDFEHKVSDMASQKELQSLKAEQRAAIERVEYRHSSGVAKENQTFGYKLGSINASNPAGKLSFEHDSAMKEAAALASSNMVIRGLGDEKLEFEHSHNLTTVRAKRVPLGLTPEAAKALEAQKKVDESKRIVESTETELRMSLAEKAQRAKDTQNAQGRNKERKEFDTAHKNASTSARTANSVGLKSTEARFAKETSAFNVKAKAAEKANKDARASTAKTLELTKLAFGVEATKENARRQIEAAGAKKKLSESKIAQDNTQSSESKALGALIRENQGSLRTQQSNINLRVKEREAYIRDRKSADSGRIKFAESDYNLTKAKDEAAAQSAKGLADSLEKTERNAISGAKAVALAAAKAALKEAQEKIKDERTTESIAEKVADARIKTAFSNETKDVARLRKKREGDTKDAERTATALLTKEKAAADLMRVQKFAAGGAVDFVAQSSGQVPGIGHEDSVPRTLDVGSFVIKKAAVEAHGANRLQNLIQKAQSLPSLGSTPTGQIKAMTMPGEIIVPKEVVSRVGTGALHALNNPASATRKLPPVLHFADGGSVGSMVDFVGNSLTVTHLGRFFAKGGEVTPLESRPSNVTQIDLRGDTTRATVMAQPGQQRNLLDVLHELKSRSA